MRPSSPSTFTYVWLEENRIFGSFAWGIKTSCPSPMQLFAVARRRGASTPERHHSVAGRQSYNGQAQRWASRIHHTISSPAQLALTGCDTSARTQLVRGRPDRAQLRRQAAQVLVGRQCLSLARSMPGTADNAALGICLAHEPTPQLHGPGES